MSMRFLAAFAGAFTLMVVLLGGAGYAIAIFAVPSPRDVFHGPGFEFTLAEGWSCELEGTEYVCSPPGTGPRAAIAIMAVKIRNDQDNLDAYQRHVEQPQKLNPNAGADAELSKVIYVRRSTYGAQTWVEARHTSSEIKNFDTYYFATNTSYIGILVTMSVHTSQTERYVKPLEQMIKTLRVYQRDS